LKNYPPSQAFLWFRDRSAALLGWRTMAGGPTAVPPAGTPSTDSPETADLRARLAAARATLTDTQRDLTTARDAIAARDAAAADAAGGMDDALGHRGAPAGAGGGRGSAADRLAAAGTAAAHGARRDATPPAGTGAAAGGPVAEHPPAGALCAAGAPLGGDDVGAYGEFDEGDDGEAVGGWVPAHSGGAVRAGLPRRTPAEESGAYDDGFDIPTRFTSSDWLQSFDIPRSVLRADGLPMPFTPCDPVHAATFHVGSHDEIEARHWYCSLAWTQQICIDVLDAKFAVGNTKEHLEELVDFLFVATRRVYALGVSRYDYLALRQSEPNLADAFAHADAIPQNSLRGDGARRFISRIVRAENTASAKFGAAERGFVYPQRAGRASAAASARSGRGGGSGGGGGGGGGSGGGGGGGSVGGGRGGGGRRGGAGRGRGRGRA